MSERAWCGKHPVHQLFVTFSRTRALRGPYVLDSHLKVCGEERGMSYSAWKKDTDVVRGEQQTEDREAEAEHKLVDVSELSSEVSV